MIWWKTMFYNKKSHPIFLKKIMIFLQVFALTFYSQLITATSSEVNSSPLPSQSTQLVAPQKYNQVRIKTAPVSIETPAGPALAHVEVLAININNKEDLEKARIELGQDIEKNPKTENLILMEVLEESAKTDPSLDDSTQVVINELKNSIIADNKKVFKPSMVHLTGVKEFFKENYNGTLAIVRFVLNSAVITTELISSKGVPLEYAAIVGILTGAMSGAVQYKSDVLYKWISNSMFVVNMAKKHGLIKTTADNSVTQEEKILNEIVFYGKWTLMEFTFLSICQTAMSLLEIATNDNILSTTAKTVVSQGLFERGVTKVEDALKKSYPNSNNTATVLRNSALFMGSGISVLCAIGVFAGIPYANMGFVLLTGLGVLLNFNPWLFKLTKREAFINEVRSGATSLTCRSLFH